MSKLWAAIVGYLQSFDPGLVKAVLFKIVRHLLTASGPVLAAHGYITGSQVEEYVALAPFVAGFAFSIYDAYVVKAKIANAVVVGRAEMGNVPQKNVAVEALKTEVKS
jgi:hypothetical protein